MTRASRILIALAALMGADGVVLAAASAHGADASRLATRMVGGRPQGYSLRGTRTREAADVHGVRRRDAGHEVYVADPLGTR